MYHSKKRLSIQRRDWRGNCCIHLSHPIILSQSPFDNQPCRFIIRWPHGPWDCQPYAKKYKSYHQLESPSRAGTDIKDVIYETCFTSTAKTSRPTWILKTEWPSHVNTLLVEHWPQLHPHFIHTEATVASAGLSRNNDFSDTTAEKQEGY